MEFWLNTVIDKVHGCPSVSRKYFPQHFLQARLLSPLHPRKTISMSTTDHCQESINRIGEVWNVCHKQGQGLTAWAAYPYSILGWCYVWLIQTLPTLLDSPSLPNMYQISWSTVFLISKGRNPSLLAESPFPLSWGGKKRRLCSDSFSSCLKITEKETLLAGNRNPGVQ